ncbi:twin transmembrane helix small protein [Emcibacteraceae bacterium]|nr:twin transmembrane helix small protein [Emcibacteraceae bacterium]
MQTILEILIPISIIITVGIMFGGAFSMTKSEGNAKKSNKMMRYRVMSQFISIILIVLYVWIRS